VDLRPLDPGTAGPNSLGGMHVCCECCVLSGRALCDGPITRPEEYYRLMCVWVWSWNLSEDARPSTAVELWKH